jgi:phosphoserine phosphatase
MAMDDLPLAVGPATTKTRRALSVADFMTGVYQISMQKFLTLVVPPDAVAVLEQDLGELVSNLTGIGCPVSHMQWLSESTAVDLLFEHGDPVEIELTARQFFTDKPVDLLGGEVSGRRKKLLIADMDSTIVTSETLDDLAAHAGLMEEIAAITAKSMRGELDFEESVRTRVGMIAGLTRSAVDETLAAVRLSAGAEALVQTMRHHGAYTALVSGGFSIFTEPVARWCNFHEHHSNRLGMAGGKLTGQVAGDILGREAKLQTLEALIEQHRLTCADVLAIGDGANDLDMIEAAGLGIAYCGKPLLNKAARARIDHTNLRTALYFQGYDDAEITAA